MATHKIEANLDVDGEVQGTSLDINGNGDIAGNLSLSGDSRILNLAANSTTSSQSRVIIGEQGLYGVSFRWDTGAELEFDGFWNSDVTGAANRDLGQVDVNNKLWTFNDNVVVGGELEATTLDINGNADISGSLTLSQYIVHSGDPDTFFGFSDPDIFKIHVGNEDVIRVNGGATSSEAAVSILCGGGSGATNVGLLLNGQTNGETLKLKMANPNTGGTNIGAGILSFEPDGDTFNIGQSTTHNNMAISIDNSENVTLINALTVTSNINANGNIVGDDSTNITNIANIEADVYSADADNSTKIQMNSNSMEFLVADSDVFDLDDTTMNVSGFLVAKKRKLAITTSTDGNADGDVVYFGSTTSMTKGKIYYYTSSGTWALADADAESTASGFLGVALGAASNTNGVLVRGMVTLANDAGNRGGTVFLSTTPGAGQASAPTGNGDIVRVVGYCLNDTQGQIYFNPDGTFVEVSA